MQDRGLGLAWVRAGDVWLQVCATFAGTGEAGGGWRTVGSLSLATGVTGRVDGKALW